uniref:Uncharacterized protein n=2 Tax=Nicotiana TaxID=4085 RepID=A0A1S3ZX07_TOBAC|nr:PREDICTED: uncharacterized protein LOC104243009 [Nicotiana sylvestris]XP_016468831.1 PREDICTED: uncharacterized protein LOC107791307 [Nicotiana tabacum]
MLDPYSFNKAVEKARHKENLLEVVTKAGKSQWNKGPTTVPNTIKLRGEAKKNSLTILLDSGSTHSFLDMEAARKIGCLIAEAVPMRVTVANGNYLMSLHICHKFRWKIQGIEFEDTVRITRLGGNDMILGGDWMKRHNPVLLDFVEYKVQVTHKGKRVELKGIYNQTELKSLSTNGVRQLLKKGQAIRSHLFTISAEEVTESSIIPAAIDKVLKQFPDVFLEPTSLPPKRAHDHYIPLKSYANPSLMNHVFKNYLRKFVLVFFDDILVYSSTMEDRVLHLRKVLEILRRDQLFAKLSKCSFGQPKVEYLGHIISGEGVSPDSSKIEAMASWPTSKTIKTLRGFLGLTGYYRRFIRKNGFHWDAEAETSFQALKQAMSSAPVLALADFNKPFIIETDACSKGMGQF